MARPARTLMFRSICIVAVAATAYAVKVGNVDPDKKPHHRRHPSKDFPSGPPADPKVIAQIPARPVDPEAPRAPCRGRGCVLHTTPAPDPWEGVPLPARAFTLEGNGLLAFSTYLSLTAGFLHRLSGDGNHKMKRLFEKIDSIVTVSGGSWYVAELLYSNITLQVQTAMAEHFGYADQVFNQTWLESYGKSCEVANATELELAPENTARRHSADLAMLNRAKAQLRASLKHQMRSGGWPDGDGSTKESLRMVEDEETINKWIDRTIDAIWNRMSCRNIRAWSHHWRDYNQAFLAQTGQMFPDTPLGAENVNEWARGKLWIPTSSVQMPGGTRFRNTSVYISQNGQKLFRYQASSGSNVSDDFPLYLPVKFSIKLGEGRQSIARFPVCANKECFGFRLTYYQEDENASGSNQLPDDYVVTTAPLANLYQEAFERAVGSVPVADVTSASSAVYAPFTMHPELYAAIPEEQAKTLFGDDTAYYAQWGSKTGGGKAMWRAEDILGSLQHQNGSKLADYNQQGFHAAVNTGLSAFSDGALVDNTGILQAVATGATHITSFVTDRMTTGYRDEYDRLKKSGHYPATSPPMTGVYELFRGATSYSGLLTYPLGHMHFQIFEESVDDAFAQFQRTADCLNLPSSELVTGICFGTIVATTVDCQWCGIEAGKKVTLKIASVMSKIELDHEPPTVEYAKYVSEVTRAMGSWSNSGKVGRALNTFFLDL